MCLVVFGWQAHPDYRLILAGNRDESHRRPTQDAHWWPDDQSILAGRDLQAGGTWLGVNKSGRFATVTNFREGPRSHGQYAGFSLLVSDGNTMSYLSNRDDLESDLIPGVYGLSNASLDTPWPKVLRARSGLESLLNSNTANETELMRLLSDRTCSR